MPWDGEDLMDLLVSQLGALSETTRRQLGAADPYCVIKRKMHHIKDTKIKQAVLDQFI